MGNEEQLAASISYMIPDFPVSVSDLKAPSPMFVQNYFIHFLLELGAEVEQFQLIDKHSATMTYPSVLSHILPLLELFGAVNYVAKQIFVKDFSLKDITQPESSRMMCILKCFDSFHTYADSLAESVQRMTRELHEKRVEYVHLQDQALSLQERVQEQGNMQNVNNVMRQEIEELKMKLVQKRQEINEFDKKVANVDSAVEKAEMKQEKVSSEYHKVSDQLAKLQTQIVNSPEVDQMDLKLRNMEGKKKESENTIQEMQKCVQEKIRQINLFKKYISDVGQGIPIMQTIIEVATENRMLDEKLQTAENRYLTTTIKEADVKEKFTKLRSKVEQLNEQKRIKKNAVEQELVEEEKKIQEAEKKLGELKASGNSSIGLKNKINAQEDEIDKKVEYNNHLCEMYDNVYETTVQKIINKVEKLGCLEGRQM